MKQLENRNTQDGVKLDEDRFQWWPQSWLRWTVE